MNFYSLGPDCRIYSIFYPFLKRGPFDWSFFYGCGSKLANQFIMNFSKNIDLFINKKYEMQYLGYTVKKTDGFVVEPYAKLSGLCFPHNNVIADSNEYIKILYRMLCVNKDILNKNATFLYLYDSTYDDPNCTKMLKDNLPVIIISDKHAQFVDVVIDYYSRPYSEAKVNYNYVKNQNKLKEYLNLKFKI